MRVRCECGNVQGTYSLVAARFANRVTCYCDDCQRFAHWLGRPECLSTRGGTDIIQIPPAALTLDANSTVSGVWAPASKTQRWYCVNCRLPLANTVQGLPFVGLFRVGVAADDQELGEAIGTSAASIFGEFSIEPQALPHGIPFGLRLRSIIKVMDWYRKGLSAPNAFFAADGSASYPLVRCSWST